MNKGMNNVEERVNSHDAIETMIVTEILANKGPFGIDADDVQDLKDSSDFIDGTIVEGRVDDLKGLIENSVDQMRKNYPQKQLVNILLKVRVAAGVELTMEHLDALHDIADELDDCIALKWGIEADTPLSNEIRLCVLCGFNE